LSVCQLIFFDLNRAVDPANPLDVSTLVSPSVWPLPFVGLNLKPDIRNVFGILRYLARKGSNSLFLALNLDHVIESSLNIRRPSDTPLLVRVMRRKYGASQFFLGVAHGVKNCGRVLGRVFICPAGGSCPCVED
jgi:hypothetical protein